MHNTKQLPIDLCKSINFRFAQVLIGNRSLGFHVLRSGRVEVGRRPEPQFERHIDRSYKHDVISNLYIGGEKRYGMGEESFGTYKMQIVAKGKKSNKSNQSIYYGSVQKSWGI